MNNEVEETVESQVEQLEEEKNSSPPKSNKKGKKSKIEDKNVAKGKAS